MPHTIVQSEFCTPTGESLTVYRCGGLVVRHRCDALRRLLRLMVASGLDGPAHTVGPNGTPRLLIRDIAGSAKFAQREHDDRGFSQAPYLAFSETARQRLAA